MTNSQLSQSSNVTIKNEILDDHIEESVSQVQPVQSEMNPSQIEPPQRIDSSDVSPPTNDEQMVTDGYNYEGKPNCLRMKRGK